MQAVEIEKIEKESPDGHPLMRERICAIEKESPDGHPLMREKICAIKEEIIEAARLRGYPEEIPQFLNDPDFCEESFVPYDEQLLRTSVKELADYAMVLEYPERFGGGLKGIVKRFVLSMVRFYVLPIVEKQNLFNGSAKDTGTQLYVCLLQQQREIEKLRDEVEKLQRGVRGQDQQKNGESV